MFALDSSVSRKSGWMAILPEQKSVTLAHVVRERNGRPEVRLLETFAVETSLRDAMRRLRSARRLKDYLCTTLLPVDECSITQMDAPAVPAEERSEALRWALQELVSYPVDTACIGVIAIPGDVLHPGRPAGVLVASAEERSVANCVAAFDAARIRLDAVDVAELAQRNVAALLEDENRGLALLRVDEAGMMLTLTFQGELIGARRGDITSLQLAAAEAETRLRARERLTLELQRSLDNFDRQHGYIRVSRVVLACTPPVEDLATELAEASYIPVQAMDLSAVLSFPSLPELQDVRLQARNLLAIGAALREGVN